MIAPSPSKRLALTMGILPERAIPSSPMSLSFRKAQLMPQRKIPRLKRYAGSERRDQESEAEPDEFQHDHSDGVPKKGIGQRRSPSK